MLSWFKAEVLRLRVAEHEFVVRRLHGAVVVLIAAVVGVVIGFTGGFVAGYHYPYKTQPRPPLPLNQIVPKSSAPDCNGTKKINGKQEPAHVMGGCLPEPRSSNAASITATQQGPDLSNNDPIVSSGAWAAIGAHNAFAVFKVNQGTYYDDRTAAPMAAQARAHGLAVGGYDFFDVCHSSPITEAHYFVSLLLADHLLGAGTLPPTGDAEYPLGTLSCNGRSWIAGWVAEVRAETGRQPIIYTGAWWWNPHIGTYWPNPSLAWISGYGVRYPFMPSGRTQLDMWQFSDAGYNGYNTSDLSVWRDGVAAFLAATQSTPPDPYALYPKTKWLLKGGVLASEYNTVKTWDAFHCKNPVQRPTCKSTHYHLELLRDRAYFVANHVVEAGKWRKLSKPRWSYPKGHPLGSRYAGITHRLAQK